MGTTFVADWAAGCAVSSQTYTGVCSTSYGGQTSATPRCWCTGAPGNSELGPADDANVADVYEGEAGELEGTLAVSVTVSDVKKTFNTVNFTITGPDGASTIVQTGSADFGPGGRTITIGTNPVLASRGKGRL